MSLIIELLAKSTVVLGAAALLVAAMRRSSASSRHLVWTGVLCAILLLPLARMALPIWRVAVLTPAQASPGSADPNSNSQSLPAASADNVTTGLVPVPSAAARPSPTVPSDATAAGSGLWADQTLLTLWLLGVVILSARRVVGWRAVHRILRDAAPVTDQGVLEQFLEVKKRFGLRRRIRLVSQREEGLPCAVGVRRPLILLPEIFLQTNARHVHSVNLVLTHEMAHIARFDAVAEHISAAAVTVFWFNPFVWMAARAARVERERAADDAVLAAGAKPSDYAAELIAIARAHSAPSWAGALPMAASALERRVHSILAAGECRGGRSGMSVTLMLVLIVVMLPVSAVQLVAKAAPDDPPTYEITAGVGSAAPAMAGVVPVIDVNTPRLRVRRTQAAERQRTGTGFVQAKQADPVPAPAKIDRTAMLRQVYDRAQKAYDSTLRRVEIGTSAPIDSLPLDAALANVAKALTLSAVTAATQVTTAEAAADIRLRFAAALARLEAAEVRYNNGMITSKELADALMAAADAVLSSSAPAAAPAPALSDAALLDSLKAASGIGSDSARAETLLDLARRYAFTPAMVTAYVDAANGIKTETDRARVFAQPIRVKPASGK